MRGFTKGVARWPWYLWRSMVGASVVILVLSAVGWRRLQRLQFINKSVSLIAANGEGITTGMIVNTTDKAEMIWIPAGEFKMGRDKIGSPSAGPKHTVHLDGYYIYRNDVTVGMYETFCRATGRSMPLKTVQDWDEKNNPMVEVTWDDARAYTHWAGASLPSEAEWEKATRGTDSREHPRGHRGDENILKNRERGSAPVGSYPGDAIPYGVMDMAGNVIQWYSDWYDEVYTNSPKKIPAGPLSSPGEFRVVRGGGGPFWQQSGSLYAYLPKLGDGGIGFRCVGPMRRPSACIQSPVNSKDSTLITPNRSTAGTRVATLRPLSEDTDARRNRQASLKPLRFDTSRLGSFKFQHNSGSFCRLVMSDQTLSLGGWRPSSGGAESHLYLATGVLEERWTMSAYGMGSGKRTITPYGDGRYPGMLRIIAREIADWKTTNRDDSGGSRPDRTLNREERRARNRLIALLNSVAADYPKAVHIPVRDVCVRDENKEMRSVLLTLSAPLATRATLLFDVKPAGDSERLWDGIPYAFASQLAPRTDTKTAERASVDLSYQQMKRNRNGRFSTVIHVPRAVPTLWYMFVVADATGRCSNVTVENSYLEGGVFRWSPKKSGAFRKP